MNDWSSLNFVHRRINYSYATVYCRSFLITFHLQNLPPGAEMKVAMFPLSGSSASSMVPPEFLELAEKALGADLGITNDNDGASEQKMEKGNFHYFFLLNLCCRRCDL